MSFLKSIFHSEPKTSEQKEVDYYPEYPKDNMRRAPSTRTTSTYRTAVASSLSSKQTVSTGGETELAKACKTGAANLSGQYLEGYKFQPEEGKSYVPGAASSSYTTAMT